MRVVRKRTEMSKKNTEIVSAQENSNCSASVSVEGCELEAKTSAEAANIPDVQVKPTGQQAPRRRLSTAYKLKILEAYDACDNSLARGALLRKEGLYHSSLTAWRKLRDENKLNHQAKNSKSTLNNQKLSRENARLKNKLEQAEAIIEIQKKVSELFGKHTQWTPDNEDN